MNVTANARFVTDLDTVEDESITARPELSKDRRRPALVRTLRAKGGKAESSATH